MLKWFVTPHKSFGGGPKLVEHSPLGGGAPWLSVLGPGKNSWEPIVRRRGAVVERLGTDLKVRECHGERFGWTFQMVGNELSSLGSDILRRPIPTRLGLEPVGPLGTERLERGGEARDADPQVSRRVQVDLLRLKRPIHARDGARTIG